MKRGRQKDSGASRFMKSTREKYFSGPFFPPGAAKSTLERRQSAVCDLQSRRASSPAAVDDLKVAGTSRPSAEIDPEAAGKRPTSAEEDPEAGRARAPSAEGDPVFADTPAPGWWGRLTAQPKEPHGAPSGASKAPFRAPECRERGSPRETESPSETPDLPSSRPNFQLGDYTIKTRRSRGSFSPLPISGEGPGERAPKGTDRVDG